MKIEIKKTHSHGIDLLTIDQLILQIEDGGIYRYYMYPPFVRDQFSVNENNQIEDDEKSP